MSLVNLIIQREYLSRVRKKSFIIMTFLGPLLFAGVVALGTYLSMQDDQQHTVLVVDETGGAFSDIRDGKNYTFDYSDIPMEQAEVLFPESEYTSLLHIPRNILNSNAALLYFKNQPSNRVQRGIERKLEDIIEKEKLALYDIDPADYKRVRSDFRITPYKFTASGEKEAVMQEDAAVGLVFGIAIYMFILLYGVQVMRGVIEEKSNRIVEVLITSVKPFQLMMGKVIGIALVGLTQFLLWIVLSSSLIGVTQSIAFSEKMDNVTTQQMEQFQQPAHGGLNQLNEEVTPFDFSHPDHLINRINWWLMFGTFIFYFLGGYLLYSALFAAIGAAVDQETDTQQFMLPVTIPLVFAYIMSFAVIENPESSAAFWGSVIPFTSPIIMMIRVAIGIEGPDIWQLFLSMAMLILGFIGTIWLAGKIYRTGILMYGKKVSYKELWKWLRYHD